MAYQFQYSDIPNDEDSVNTQKPAPGYSFKSSDIPEEEELSTSLSPSPSSNSLGNEILSNVLNAGKNFGDFMQGVGSGLYNTYKTPLPQVAQNYLPNAPQSQGFFGKSGNVVGDTLGFIAGGDILDAARAGVAGVERVPELVSKAASWLGGSSLPSTIARQGIGGAIYGGLENPDDRLKSAAEGLGVGGVGATLPSIASQAGKIFGWVNPEKYAQDILSDMGKSADLTSNAQIVAKEVNDAYKAQQTPISEKFNAILDKYKDEPIQKTGFPIYGEGSPTPVFKTPYDIAVDQNEDYLTKGIKNLQDTYEKNPTYGNARSLYTQYIKDMGLINPNGDPNLANQKEVLGNLASNLNDDIYSFLSSRKEGIEDIPGFIDSKQDNLGDYYKDLQQQWKNNVVPYQKSGASQLLGKNPDIGVNVASLFGSKSSIPDPNDVKVFSDLSPDTQKKIIYSAIGSQPQIRTPQSLMGAYNKLNDQGLIGLVPPDIRQKFQLLSDSITRQKALNAGAGIGLGGAIAHGLGVGDFGSSIGGGVGAYIGNKVLPAFYKSPIFQGSKNGISSALNNSYPYISSGLKSNIIPNSKNNS